MAVNDAGRARPLFSGAESLGVSAGEVAVALDLILASDAFAHVERPSRFLRHLVEATLNGQQTLLKETLLGIQVFGREASWDTRVDPIVRQEAARLRKRLARYYEAASPEIRIDLPVGAFVPVFHRVPGPAVEGEIPLSPVFEPTPAVVPPMTAPAEVGPIEVAPKKGQRLLWLAFAGLVLLLGT